MSHNSLKEVYSPPFPPPPTTNYFTGAYKDTGNDLMIDNDMEVPEEEEIGLMNTYEEKERGEGEEKPSGELIYGLSHILNTVEIEGEEETGKKKEKEMIDMFTYIGKREEDNDHSIDVQYDILNYPRLYTVILLSPTSSSLLRNFSIITIPYKLQKKDHYLFEELPPYKTYIYNYIPPIIPTNLVVLKVQLLSQVSLVNKSMLLKVLGTLWCPFWSTLLGFRSFGSCSRVGLEVMLEVLRYILKSNLVIFWQNSPKSITGIPDSVFKKKVNII
ncbi:hypothetical protein WA158_000291 [Blastocystis sp. Blastoise]